MDIPIKGEHHDYLARAEHVGEWLAAERLRIEMEARHVLMQMQRHDLQLRAFVQQTHGITGDMTLDTERGVIIVPDPPEPPKEDADASEQ